QSLVQQRRYALWKIVHGIHLIGCSISIQCTLSTERILLRWYLKTLHAVSSQLFLPSFFLLIPSTPSFTFYFTFISSSLQWRGGGPPRESGLLSSTPKSLSRLLVPIKRCSTNLDLPLLPSSSKDISTSSSTCTNRVIFALAFECPIPQISEIEFLTAIPPSTLKISCALHENSLTI
ncbi:MAG: hypothetical protein J3R72DRAFT_471937, partial [Linnemannia gamsii]